MASVQAEWPASLQSLQWSEPAWVRIDLHPRLLGLALPGVASGLPLAVLPEHTCSVQITQLDML